MKELYQMLIKPKEVKLECEEKVQEINSKDEIKS